jgi:hypothetical protein
MATYKSDLRRLSLVALSPPRPVLRLAGIFTCLRVQMELFLSFTNVGQRMKRRANSAVILVSTFEIKYDGVPV